MFTPDVRLEGFSPAEWLTLGELLRGRPDAAAGLGGKRGIVALTRGDKLIKLVSTADGRIDPEGRLWPIGLPALAGLHGARWAARLSLGALDELGDRFAAGLEPRHDLLDQVLALLGIARELEREGLLEVWPWRIEHWPIPSAQMVLRAFDAACGRGRVLLLGAFADGKVKSAVALRRGATGFDWVVGPSVLLSGIGLLSGDWRRDYRYLSQVTERRVGPLATGCFGEFRTLQALMSESEPGAWAQAVAARDIVLAPITAALAVPLGFDAGRAALIALRGLALRLGTTWLGSGGALSGALDRVQGLESMLGFDPIALLGRLLGREIHYRRLGSRGADPASQSKHGTRT